MTLEELESELREIKSDLETRSAIRAVNTKWVIFIGTIILAALGITNFYTIPKEVNDAAVAATKTSIGPDVLKKRDELLASLQQSKDKSDGLIKEIAASSHLQVGAVGVGNGGDGVKVVSVSFPRPFNSVPIVIAVPRGEGSYTDTFAVTTRNVSNSGFTVNIARADTSEAESWGQKLSLDWIAWEQ